MLTKIKDSLFNSFTLAVDGATPSPVWLLTAKALATQDVMVSGMVVFIVTWPFALKCKKLEFHTSRLLRFGILHFDLMV